MDLVAVLRASWRRWYVVLAILALMAAAAADLHRSAVPSYSVSSTIVVTPTVASIDPELAEVGLAEGNLNPYGSPGVLAQLLSRNLAQAVGAPETARLTAEWDALRPTLVSIRSEAEDVDVARAAMAVVLETAQTQLLEVQVRAGLVGEGTFQVVVAVTPDQVVRTQPDRMGLVTYVMGAGVLLAITAAVVLDIRVGRRANRPLSSRPPHEYEVLTP